DLGDPPEPGHDEAAERLVGPVVGDDEVGEVRELVGAHDTGDGPAAVSGLVGAGAAAVVLVGHLADDLLDDVLEGDDAGRAAVLVDDDRHLHAVVTQGDEQRGEPERLGDARCRDHQAAGRHRDVGAAVVGHGDGAAQVDQADDVVVVVTEDREAGVAGAAGGGD